MPAVTQYCTVADLSAKGVGGTAMDAVPIEDRTSAIQSASGVMDSYLQGQYKLPLNTASGTSTDLAPEIVRCCAILASWELLVVRGFNPEGDTIETLENRYNGQMRWLRDISKGTAAPNISDSSGAPTRHGRGPRVIKSGSRGYSSRGSTDNRGTFGGD